MNFTKKQIDAINKISVNSSFSGAWNADGYLCAMSDTIGIRIHEENAPTEGINMCQVPVTMDFNRIIDDLMEGSQHDYYRVDAVTSKKLNEIKNQIRSIAPKFIRENGLLVMLVSNGKPYIYFNGELLLKMFDVMPKDCNVYIDRKGGWRQPTLFCDKDFNMHGVVLPCRNTEENFNILYMQNGVDPSVAIIEINLKD